MVQEGKVPNPLSESYIERSDDLKKVIPLLEIIKSEFIDVNKKLEGKNEEEREHILKDYESDCYKNYFPLLMKINLRQGRLLLLLIHRELGNTPYDILHQYLGNKRANFWQGVAWLLSANLKKEYNPRKELLTEHLMLKMYDREITTNLNSIKTSPKK